ncbi:kinase-like domain-containing protein [Mycena metata]|uniref:Kinase-like domain-containing protein n=1 Tax=Mycena metata TaxID=1033252 RepID=A0AAD7I887_9AGAR|nr:kinase-like domain-containing protein [Mycena metata]
MSLPVVSVLSAAFTVFEFILATVQTVKAARNQLDVLSTSTQKLLTTLNQEFTESRLIPEQCDKALPDLDILLRDILRYTERIKDSGFLKLLLQKDSRAFKIETFQKRIGVCINAFQISSILNIQSMLAESKSAQSRDTETLHSYLSTLAKSNAKLLQTLEINQDNTIAMMVSIQKQLNNDNVDHAEKTFYTHTLEYLTTRSGKTVKVEEWMVSPFDVDYNNEIGSGGFGTVYHGTWNRTEVAIKVLQNAGGMKPSSASLQNETHIWATLRHPNILQFLGANTLDDKPFIVMPYVPHNAREFLRTRPTFDPLYILRDVSLGLEYLHSRKICHGDLKAINVLVENSGKALLCDFGLARLKADAASRTLANSEAPPSVGSRHWMAPELLNGSRAREASDVYAFGMTLYELYTDEIPLFSVPYADLFELVVTRGGRPSRPRLHEGRPMTDETWELAEQCWTGDPHTRPTATQIHDTITYAISHLPHRLVVSATCVPSNPAEPDLGLKLDWMSDSDIELAQAAVSEDYLDNMITQDSWDLDIDGFRRLARRQITVVFSREAALGASHPRTLAAMSDLATTYTHLGMFEPAKMIQLHVVAGRTEMLGADHDDTLTAMRQLAVLYRKLERPQDALNIGLDLVQRRDGSLGNTHVETLKASYDLGRTYYHLRRYDEAAKLQHHVVQRFQQHELRFETRHYETLIAMESLAETYIKLNKYHKACHLMYEVAARSKSIFGKDHPYTIAVKKRQKKFDLAIGEGFPTCISCHK